MQRVLHVLALLLLATLPSVAVRADDLAKMKDLLEKKFPQVEVEKIVPSEVLPGWYEVVTAGGLAFASADGRHLFQGTLIDLASMTDLSRERWSALNRIDFAALPLNLAVTVKKGKGSRVMAVFSDPLCPYCRQLEQQIKDLDDVTVHTFLFPIESIHPGATEKSRQVWCAKDRASTWTRWMLEEKIDAQTARCEFQGLKTVEALGKQLNVMATPTLFLADGSRIDGVIEKDALEKALNEVRQAADLASR